MRDPGRTTLFLLLLTLASSSVDGAERHEQILEEARAMKPRLVECRRDFHMHPELSNREERTAKRISEILAGLGIPHTTGIAGHGVVAEIKGGRPGPSVAVRADIDALPIEEVNDVPYRSQNPGVKHACGHDLHATAALGTAELLWKRRASLPGTVFIIFQPAEEGPPPGEEGGAPRMIKEGLLDRIRPAAMFALHSMPTLEVGSVSFAHGAEMASSDRFKITVIGRQSHGAEPHRGIDPIVAASQIVLALQTISSRKIDPLQPVVVTVGMFNAGSRFNIVPGEAVLEGTFRTLDPEVRRKTRESIELISRSVAEGAGAKAEVWFHDSAANPVLINDPELTRFAQRSLESLLGPAHVKIDPPRMIAEDFAHFAERVPSFYFFVGVRNEEKGITANLHTPDFDIDEEALVVGTAAMTNLVLDYLER
ncbi:MAG TPA: amidohydrolase [Thermoanaerobaculia bacterium]|nr:amidohydrolase [Thermoanaerobaculia bacterium]